MLYYRVITVLPAPEPRGAPFLWIPDITLPDPLYILPAVNVGLCYVVYKINMNLLMRAGAMPNSQPLLG